MMVSQKIRILFSTFCSLGTNITFICEETRTDNGANLLVSALIIFMKLKQLFVGISIVSLGIFVNYKYRASDYILITVESFSVYWLRKLLLYVPHSR